MAHYLLPHSVYVDDDQSFVEELTVSAEEFAALFEEHTNDYSPAT